MLAILFISSAALLTPMQPLRPTLKAHRFSKIRGADDGSNAATDPLEPAAWPEPANTVADLQAKEAAAKEAAEAAALASPKPLLDESGEFNLVALATVVVFVIGGSLFFSGISGSGTARFVSDQPPEVQACLREATTRSEASACLPPVPLE